jgi:hypothetical protein
MPVHRLLGDRGFHAQRTVLEHLHTDIIFESNMDDHRFHADLSFATTMDRLWET